MPDLQKLTEALSEFVDTPILVVGDLMIDEYIWGHVRRISPEAPVQVVEAEKEESAQLVVTAQERVKAERDKNNSIYFLFSKSVQDSLLICQF